MAQKKAKSAVLSPSDSELRRWCIEMAMKWPTIGPPVPTAYQNHLGQLGLASQETDIVGRANRILAWVKTVA